MRTIFLVVLVAASAISQSLSEWHQWRGPHRDGVWHEEGVTDSLPDEIPVKWRTSIGAGYCGPMRTTTRLCRPTCWPHVT